MCEVPLRVVRSPYKVFIVLLTNIFDMFFYLVVCGNVLIKMTSEQAELQNKY